MNSRLLRKNESCWSTSSGLPDAADNFEIGLNFENLALESALKNDTHQTKYLQLHNQTLQKLYKTQVKKLPQLKTKNTLQTSKYLKTKPLNLKARYLNISKEPSFIKAKESGSLSQMRTETSFNTSTKFFNQPNQEGVKQFNRKKLKTLCTKQKESFQITYGSASFCVSEIQSGLISNETGLRANQSINELMQQKWSSVRNYQFSKLNRKDILPVPHNLTKSKTKLFQRRMSRTISKQIFSNYQISHLFSLTKKKQ